MTRGASAREIANRILNVERFREIQNRAGVDERTLLAYYEGKARPGRTTERIENAIRDYFAELDKHD